MNFTIWKLENIEKSTYAQERRDKIQCGMFQFIYTFRTFPRNAASKFGFRPPNVISSVWGTKLSVLSDIGGIGDFRQMWVSFRTTIWKKWRRCFEVASTNTLILDICLSTNVHSINETIGVGEFCGTVCLSTQ
ncbi:hypothetical protein CRM22_010209 [Opisthorchis felineus]|uniref:Uncharacterized protein n=1 Tax=Opisthorchis felineus TaxID=147828 RepID=A0A4S2L654_OPIFE|nr:hypothetical protein CRM22_010209 [Opisthorchis felineus]